MKIGLYNDSFPPTIDGVANTVLSYAKFIHKNHDEAIVVTPKYPNVTDDYPFEVYRYPSMPAFGTIPYRTGNPFLPATLMDLHSKNIDLIHVHSPFVSSLLANQQNNFNHKKLPLVLTYHTKYDIDIDKFVPNTKVQKVAKRFVLHNINLADEVWTVTDGAGKWLQQTGYNKDYIVMPNGTDFPKGIADKSQIGELKRIHNINDDEIIFLFVGRMMWYKNIKLILDTISEVSKSNIKFHAFMVGDGTDRPAIEKYTNDIGIKSLVTFTGAIYDREIVRAYFSLADLFLFPSTYDTSGLVVKEAAACDCPSLLVKGSCASECVTDLETGLIAEDNATDCARKIIDAVRAPLLLMALGKSANEYVYLSWEDAVAKAYERYGVVADNFKSKHHKKWF